MYIVYTGSVDLYMISLKVNRLIQFRSLQCWNEWPWPFFLCTKVHRSCF